MHEDRIQILEMLVQGKLTVEEADYLLEALFGLADKKGNSNGQQQHSMPETKPTNPH